MLNKHYSVSFFEYKSKPTTTMKNTPQLSFTSRLIKYNFQRYCFCGCTSIHTLKTTDSLIGLPLIATFDQLSGFTKTWLGQANGGYLHLFYIAESCSTNFKRGKLSML